MDEFCNRLKYLDLPIKLDIKYYCINCKVRRIIIDNFKEFGYIYIRGSNGSLLPGTLQDYEDSLIKYKCLF